MTPEEFADAVLELIEYGPAPTCELTVRRPFGDPLYYLGNVSGALRYLSVVNNQYKDHRG
jgi:hypothetical protein